MSHARGFNFVPNDSSEGLAEFEDTGMDCHDYQQDYMVGGCVKLTLLCAGAPDRPRVASLEEIFRLKCMACANRSKTRDWLDMQVMLQWACFSHWTFTLV